MMELIYNNEFIIPFCNAFNAIKRGSIFLNPKFSVRKGAIGSFSIYSLELIKHEGSKKELFVEAKVSGIFREEEVISVKQKLAADCITKVLQHYGI